jgi:hypothetical protein
VFVVLVIVLTGSIVAIAYLCVLPLILRTYSVPRLCWHFFYSHWNLILIVFHYYQAITTPPGYPPQVGPHRAWGGAELPAVLASPIYGRENDLGSLEAEIFSYYCGQNVLLNVHRAGMTLLLSPSVRSAFIPSQPEHTTAASVIGGSQLCSEPHLRANRPWS